MQEFITDKRMFKAGMLRIVMKMRKEKDTSFDGCFSAVTKELRLEPDQFRSYVTSHMPEMMASVKTQGKRIYWEM